MFAVCMEVCLSHSATRSSRNIVLSKLVRTRRTNIARPFGPARFSRIATPLIYWPTPHPILWPCIRSHPTLPTPSANSAAQMEPRDEPIVSPGSPREGTAGPAQVAQQFDSSFREIKIPRRLDRTVKRELSGLQILVSLAHDSKKKLA